VHFAYFVNVHFSSYIGFFVDDIGRFTNDIFDRLRSASGLKSASTDVIISNQGPFYTIFSNWYPFQILRPMAELLVRVRVRAYVIGLRFEKVRNGHRFENWTSI
jgi:hypothetical protein